VALAERRSTDATKSFTERGTRARRRSPSCEYGLAAVAYEQGEDARVPSGCSGRARCRAAKPHRSALLYVLAALRAEDKGWPAAVGYAKRLVTDFTR